MVFSAIRGFSKITRYLPAARTILSSNCGNVIRPGEITSNARTITRSMFVLCRNRDNNPLDVLGAYSVASPASSKCSCGCDIHTQGKEIGDKELVAFLEEEIANETKSQPKVTLSQELGDFICKFEGSEVTFTRKFNNEKITISTNVNHSVDAEEAEQDPSNTKNEENLEMSAKPDFTVEIAKQNKILCFECSFVRFLPEEEEGQTNYNDTFQITDISMYENKESDSTYAVAGDIMDGYLYDLLMNYLDERGITNDFVDKMGTVLTTYEHRLYVGLLQGIKNFVEK